MLDPALLSHLILWLIGGMTVVTAVATTIAMVGMGRTGYRKD